MRDFAKRLLPPIVLEIVRAVRRGRRRPTSWIQVQQGILRGYWLYGSPRSGMTRGVYEAPLMSAMSDAVRPGWVCFDVGAHSGYHSLVLAALTGNEGRVHAFEPLPFNLRRLATTIERNNLGSIVHVHAIALSDRNGPAAIVGSASARGSGRGVLVGGRGEAALRRRGFPEIAVEQRRIDDLIGQDGIAAPQFIKVDVEGAEPAVLRGAMNTLHTVRPVLAIEVHSAASAVECADLLTSLGYRLRVIEDQEDVRCLVLATSTLAPAS